MKKIYLKTLHIFRRDLRLEDNTALIAALTLSNEVIPCFIFDKRQIEHNDYKSDHCIQFMSASLQELDIALRKKGSKMYFFYGVTEKIINQLIDDQKIQAIFLNRDYTPFSKERDNQIELACRDHGIAYHCYADALLNEPEQVLKPNNTPYTIFTHAFNRAKQLKIEKPKKNHFSNYYKKPITGEDTRTLSKLLQRQNPSIVLKGGRKEALQLLKKIPQLSNYQDKRNIPSTNSTTHLSAHNKFGTVSIREVYDTIVQSLGKNHPLIRELYWRDFFTHITFHFPRVLGHAFQKKYSAIQWNSNEKKFQRWCQGLTGFPIVDAGMRELNTTGFMHNRIRMIVASFLTKDLHLDWRRGEKYFAQKLVDYDPAVNNGNWQWAASTGCDAQPYFRIFNPWLQQKKFDPDCIYIKHWIPELQDYSARDIHTLYKKLSSLSPSYPTPIVNHAVESQKAKERYAKCQGRGG